MLQQALMEDDVEGAGGEGHVQTVAADGHHRDLGLIGGDLGQPQRTRHVVEGPDLGAGTGQGHGVATGAGPDFKDPFALQIAQSRDLAHQPTVIVIDVVQTVSVGLFPEVLPVLGCGFPHD